jgi:hypothetical protein
MNVQELIPPPDVIRAELARTVREADVLRLLLKAATRADGDRRFVQFLRDRQPEAACPEAVTRA